MDASGTLPSQSVCLHTCVRKDVLLTSLRNRQPRQFHQLVQGPPTNFHKVLIQGSSIFGGDRLYLSNLYQYRVILSWVV